MLVRQAEKRDIPQMLEIYNYEVEHGVSTLDLSQKMQEEWEAWFEMHNKDNHPLLAAEIKDRLAGYACLSPYREKEAYRSTVELSIYVDPACRNKKIASGLMEALISYARKDERTHLIVSVITSGNEPSIRLHEKYGFQYCGTLHEVGWKKGKYQSVDNYELRV